MVYAAHDNYRPGHYSAKQFQSGSKLKYATNFRELLYNYSQADSFTMQHVKQLYTYINLPHSLRG